MSFGIAAQWMQVAVMVSNKGGKIKPKVIYNEPGEITN